MAETSKEREPEPVVFFDLTLGGMELVLPSILALQSLRQPCFVRFVPAWPQSIKSCMSEGCI